MLIFCMRKIYAFDLCCKTEQQNFIIRETFANLHKFQSDTEHCNGTAYSKNINHHRDRSLITAC